VENISISSLYPSFSSRIPLVHEDTQLLLIFDLDQLLAAVGRLFFAMLVWEFRGGNSSGLTKEMFCCAYVSNCLDLYIMRYRMDGNTYQLHGGGVVVEN
jgi:hypothetical protein